MFFYPIGHAGLPDQLMERFRPVMTTIFNKGNEVSGTKALREQRGQLNERFVAIINRSEFENRDLTPEEDAELGEIIKKDDELKNRIQRQEDLSRRELENAQLIDRRGGSFDWGQPGNVGGTDSDIDMAVAAFACASLGRQTDAATVDRASRAGYQPGAAALEIPLNLIRPTQGSLASFSRSPQGAMSTKQPGKGGAIVPRGFLGRFEKALKQFGPMLETSQVWISQDGRETHWPTLDDTNMEGFLIGENEEATETDMKVGAHVFRAHKISSGLLKVSHELLEDTPIDLAGEIGEAFGIRIGRAINRLCTLGNAPNGPRGIVHSAVTGKETASSTAIIADEFIDLINSVDPAYRSSPGTGWMMHPDVWGALTKLKDSHGQYLTGTLEAGAVPKLRGYDVHFNPLMPSTLEAGNRIALFGDLAAYKLRMVGQVRLFVMRETYAAADQTGFVAFARVDGALLDAGTHPIKCLQMKPAG